MTSSTAFCGNARRISNGAGGVDEVGWPPRRAWSSTFPPSLTVASQDDLQRGSAPTFDSARYREVAGSLRHGRRPSVDPRPTRTDRPGFTCQAFNALSLEPPLVVFAPSRTSQSWAEDRSNESLLPPTCCRRARRALARVFATKDHRKFDGVGWRPGTTGSPILQERAGVVGRVPLGRWPTTAGTTSSPSARPAPTWASGRGHPAHVLPGRLSAASRRGAPSLSPTCPPIHRLRAGSWIVVVVGARRSR